jgi:NAD(P)-dependent dehydrogenase (short-subunit alcohol dehydrogenase family)
MTLPAQFRIVVTGAGSGLGRAICVEAVKRGARVLASDIDLAAAKATCELLRGATAHAVKCDVSREADVVALADAADQLYGGTDLIVNNAGVAVGGLVGEVILEHWRWIMDINLWGVVHGCHVFVPRLRKQGHGHILNVASAAGLLSPPTMAPYNVTKAGVVALSETLASELSGTPIRVSVLCPTFFRTGIVKSARGLVEGMAEMTENLMSRAKLQADGVARAALDGVEAEKLYVVPHPDGQWMWRLKRLAPDSFHQRALKLVRAQARRFGIRME